VSAAAVQTDELELTECVVLRDAIGDLTVHGKATNASAREFSAVLGATFYGADRQIIGTASGVVNQLKPGASKTFSLMTLDDVAGYADFAVQIDTIL
jgi:hypothetical protein